MSWQQKIKIIGAAVFFSFSIMHNAIGADAANNVTGSSQVGHNPEFDAKSRVRIYQTGTPDEKYNVGFSFLDHNDNQAAHWFFLTAMEGHKDALKQLQVIARKGNINAQNGLVDIFLNAEGVQDVNQVPHWLQEAVQKDSASTQLHCGIIFKNGIGVAVDNRNAATLFLHAADINNENNLAICFLQEMAAAGIADAQYNLGVFHKLKNNAVAAEMWYRKAADQEHPLALYGLACLFWYDELVEKNEQEAARLYFAAATQAITELSRRFGNVETPEAEMDDAKTELRFVAKLAPKELERMAYSRVVDAQFYWARLSQDGTGVNQDDQQAVCWFSLAAMQGHEGALKQLQAMANKGNIYAQNDLDILLHSSKRFEQDHKQVVSWFSRADIRCGAENTTLIDMLLEYRPFARVRNAVDFLVVHYAITNVNYTKTLPDIEARKWLRAFYKVGFEDYNLSPLQMLEIAGLKHRLVIAPQYRQRQAEHILIVYATIAEGYSKRRGMTDINDLWQEGVKAIGHKLNAEDITQTFNEDYRTATMQYIRTRLEASDPDIAM